MALAGLHARTKTGEFRGPETKSGVPIYAGGASQFEEWKFRTMLRYRGCKDEDKPKLVSIITDGLRDEALSLAMEWSEKPDNKSAAPGLGFSIPSNSTILETM